jgi:hypothetical protein
MEGRWGVGSGVGVLGKVDGVLVPEWGCYGWFRSRCAMEGRWGVGSGVGVLGKVVGVLVPEWVCYGG